MATYAKLNSGEWGLRVPGRPREGQQVTVQKRSGESRAETIGKVVWSGNGFSLCTIEASNRQSPRATERTYQRRYGWDGVRGSASYYSSGMYDQES